MRKATFGGSIVLIFAIYFALLSLGQAMESNARRHVGAA
jgi:hypothetical protein